jgi:hypothetical protein
MPINRELSQFGSFVEVANSTKLGIVNPNVGIGTTNPTVKVEVHGDIKVVDGNIDANGNLDVDGYSDLDELNVTGIATFTNGIQCSGSAMNVTAGFVANTARVSDLTDNRVVIAGNSGELEGDSNFTFDGSTLSVGADFTLTGIDTGTSAGPEFKLFRNSSSPADADYLGQIKFAGESDTGVERNYAKITGKILDASNGIEDGIIEFTHIKAGSQNISARFRSDSLQLLNGTNFSVDGDSTLTGDLDVDGHTDLDYVAVSAAATFTSLVDVNGGLQANSIKIEDLTDNRVVIAGVGGELEDNSKFTFNGETVNINAQLTVSGVSTFSGGISMGSGSVGLTTNSITGPAEMFIDPAAVGDNTGVVRIKGDLYVDGTTTQINSETLTIADFVVGIASTATTDSLADGAGINIGPDNTFKYDHTNTSLKSSENLNVASGKTYKVNGTDVLSATTLGSAVVSSSLTSVGTLSALTVSGDVSIADKIVHTGDTNTAIRFPADDTITAETGGTEKLRITSDGSVGIGTDNPASKLQVNGTIRVRGPATPNINLSPLSGGVGNADISFDGDDLRIVSNSSGADVRINAVSRNNDFVLKPSGDIGIGTDNPTNTLEISKASNHGITLTRPAGGSNPGTVKFEVHSNGAGRLISERDFNLNFDTDNIGNQNFSVSANGTERLRITSAGLVGIGTADPQSQFEVFGSSPVVRSKNTTNQTYTEISNDGTDGYVDWSSGDLVFRSASNTERLRIKTGGNIGIGGTSAPRAKFDFGSGTGHGILNQTLANYQAVFESPQGTGNISRNIGFAVGTNGIGAAINAVDNGGTDATGLIFATGTAGSIAERLRITDNGSTIIGGTTPATVGQTQLTLRSNGQVGLSLLCGAIQNSTIYMGGLADGYSSGDSGYSDGAISYNNSSNHMQFDTAGTEKLRITSAGYVGIGTDSPDGKLDVRGTIFVNGDATGGRIFASGGSLSLTDGNGRQTLRIDDPGSGNTHTHVFDSNGRLGINSTTPAVKLDIRSTDAIRVPVGTTGERPTGAAGYIRYNSSIASYEGHNGSEWAGIGGAAEVETAVSSTSATTCESFAKASYRSASIVAQITQGSSYQVGNYLLIHDGTTATLVEESAVATGDMLGTFTATISGSNVVFQVNMNSASSATVTTMMTKVSIP